MVQIDKIEQMPEDIRERAGRLGKRRSAELESIANMQVGDVLRFTGEKEEVYMVRKKAEAWRKRYREKGLDYLICQNSGVLYVERVK